MVIHSKKFFLDKVICVGEKELELLLQQRADNIISMEIDKKRGKRKIYYIGKGEIREKYENIQKNLLKNFLNQISLPSVVKGFKKESCYNKYLAEHIGNKFFLHLDIKDFFGSITKEHITEALKTFVLDQEVMDLIIKICMIDNEGKIIVPQGWITSPAISNIIFRKLDQCILKYCQSIHKIRDRKDGQCKQVEIVYTRYADDLLFSSDYFDFHEYMYFQRKIRYILSCNGFQCNKKKTVLSNEKVALGGYVVGSDMHLSNKKLRTINTIIHFFDGRNDCMEGKAYIVDSEKVRNKEIYKQINEMKIIHRGKELKFVNNEGIICFLNGYRAFLISIVKENKNRTAKILKLEKTIRKIEKISESMQEV